ncbi:unnamed protein product [Hymenolepis diminuta]|uniref:GPI ethanolamine phosphate transferase 1 n=1 Tax=Hymenolepis diminuta TaxID=6216 RepID=A0A564XZ70_HYMDI|nr:unnamed protein product [Hymenolepis diminuta]
MKCYNFCIPTIFISYVINIFVILLTTFNSSIPNYVEPVGYTKMPPFSKRVILISIDGLAIHILQTSEQNRISFLMRMAETKGVMGIVKAEAPTETRPRHVALLSGFNEDLFNIWGFWKRNLHPFESILHNAQFSWAYGDPVAIKPFLVEATDRRSSSMKLEYYPEISHNSMYADDFVLKKFKTFIETDLNKFIEADEVTQDGRRGKLLFLHLCSVDDAGHHGGYNAPLYDQIVLNANVIIEQIYELYRKKVSEEDLVSTTFIVTADHGTKPEGGHGGSTDDEIFVPFFAWGAGIANIPNSNHAFSLLAQQNSVSTLVASLLSTLIPSYSQGSLPIHLLNASDQIKSNLLRSNILHLMKLNEALIHKANRHSIISSFTSIGPQANFDDRVEDLKSLMKRERVLLNSLFHSKWMLWSRASFLWTISAALTSFAIVVDLMGYRTSKIAPNYTTIFRICTLLIALIELFRVIDCCRDKLLNFLDYTTEPNFREICVLPFMCLITDFILGGYVSSGRLMISKMLEHFKMSKYQILSFVLLFLQSYLIIAAFHRPEFHAAAGVIVSINLIFNPFRNTEWKFARIFSLVLTILYSLWMLILHSQPIETNPNLLGHQIILGFILLSLWILFNAVTYSIKIDRIMLHEWFLLEFQNLLLHVSI